MPRLNLIYTSVLAAVVSLVAALSVIAQPACASPSRRPIASRTVPGANLNTELNANGGSDLPAGSNANAESRYSAGPNANADSTGNVGSNLVAPSAIPAAIDGAGTVESFFDLTQKAPPAAPSLEPVRTSSAHEKLSVSPAYLPSNKSRHHFVYHLLDNIGVPLSTKDIDGLDPALKGLEYNPQKTVEPGVASSLERIQPPEQNDLSTMQTINKKIPQSELEGTMYDSSSEAKAEEKAP